MDNAKASTIKATVEEEIGLAVQSANLKIRTKKAEDNSWNATTDENIGIIVDILEDDLKEGYTVTPGTLNATTGIRTLEVVYAGDNYKKATKNPDATITKTLEVSQNKIVIEQDSETGGVDPASVWTWTDTNESGYLDLGDVVTHISGESFYIINDAADTYTLLAKYCVNTETNAQDSTVGIYNEEGTTGAIVFDDSTNIYEDSSIKGYVDAYVNSKIGGDAVGRLLWIEEVNTMDIFDETLYREIITGESGLFCYWGYAPTEISADQPDVAIAWVPSGHIEVVPPTTGGLVALRPVVLIAAEDFLDGPLCNHSWEDGEILREATCEETGMGIRTCTVCGQSKTKVIPATGVHNFDSGKCSVCRIDQATGLHLGAEINYKEFISPSGSEFETMPNYTSPKEKTGHSDDQKFEVKNDSGIKWIILGKENGQIKITTTTVVRPTSGGYENNGFKYYRLVGQDGYINFVNELNAIGAIYGKGKYADRGRSFIREDLGYTYSRTGTAYKYAKHSNGKIYRYAADEVVDGTSTTGGYANFWYTDFDASNSTEEPSTNEWHNLADATGETLPSVTIYPYTYSRSRTLNGIIENPRDDYFLASRNLYFGDDRVAFSVRYVYYWDDDRMSYLSNSDRSGGGCSCSVRPVVYLKSDVQLSYDPDNYAYTILEPGT